MLQILKKSIREVDLQIRALMRSDAGLRTDAELLKSIPGIADYAAAVILSAIGSVSSFQSAKQLVAFCGLDPTAIRPIHWHAQQDIQARIKVFAVYFEYVRPHFYPAWM